MFLFTAGIIGLIFESAMVFWLRQSEQVTDARRSHRSFLSVHRFRAPQLPEYFLSRRSPRGTSAIVRLQGGAGDYRKQVQDVLQHNTRTAVVTRPRPVLYVHKAFNLHKAA